MFLVFRPEGASEPAAYEVLPAKVGRKRAAMAERVYTKAVGERRTWQQLIADAHQGSMEAWTVLLWVAQTADHPGLRYENMDDFDSGALVMEHSKEEVRQMLAAIRTSDAMLESERTALIAQLELGLETARVGQDEPAPKPDPAVAESDAGKADDEPTLEASTS